MTYQKNVPWNVNFDQPYEGQPKSAASRRVIDAHIHFQMLIFQ